MGMRYASMTLLLILLTALVGCPAPPWLTTRLHVLQAELGEVSETGEPGIYALALTGVDDKVVWFTDRPWRLADSESLDDFAWNTWPRVLMGEGPTGAMAYQDAEGYWSMVPVKAAGIETGSQAHTMTWLMEIKGAPDLGLIRDVHVYLDDRGASETAEGESFVFLHGAARVALEPQKDKDAYTLRLSYPYPVVATIETGAGSGMYVQPLEGFIEDVWTTGDFVENPPNAAVQIEGPDGATHVFVAVLSEPAYDPAANEMTYRAELLYGDPDVLPGPGVLFIDDWDDDDDTRIYKVVINHEKQYSVWPADRENPLGWNDVGKEGTRRECIDYIEEVWTDMWPPSLRTEMDARDLADSPYCRISDYVTESGPVAIVQLLRELTRREGTATLRRAVGAVLEAGHRRIVLEMWGLTYIDAYGVGEMISAYHVATNQGARMVLAHIAPRLYSCDINPLLTVFDVYDSKEDAVASFQN